MATKITRQCVCIELFKIHYRSHNSKWQWTHVILCFGTCENNWLPDIIYCKNIQSEFGESHTNMPIDLESQTHESICLPQHGACLSFAFFDVIRIIRVYA